MRQSACTTQIEIPRSPYLQKSRSQQQFASSVLKQLTSSTTSARSGRLARLILSFKSLTSQSQPQFSSYISKHSIPTTTASKSNSSSFIKTKRNSLNVNPPAPPSIHLLQWINTFSLLIAHICHTSADTLPPSSHFTSRHFSTFNQIYLGRILFFSVALCRPNVFSL